jgi:hypothetical protein
MELPGVVDIVRRPPARWARLCLGRLRARRVPAVKVMAAA